jgi:hypothetical protein
MRSLERPHSAADPRPSVLLLVVDSLRTDRIESPDVMPATRHLLLEGTLFRHAFTPVARTFPSWVSLLTGREPRHTGVRMFPDPRRPGPGPTFVTELRDRSTFVVSTARHVPIRVGRRGGHPILTAHLARSTVLPLTAGPALPPPAPLREAFPNGGISRA